MNNHAKSALALALAIVGGIAAGMRCDASEWVENSSQINPRGAAYYTVKTYTEGSDPFIPLHHYIALRYQAGTDLAEPLHGEFRDEERKGVSYDSSL